MLKKKILKFVFVLACIMTLIMPYTTTVLAAALTQEDTTADLQSIIVHKGGEESSGTLTDEQAKIYDETAYGYKVGETRVFKIIVKGDTNYENTFYCLNAEKSFPGVQSDGENSLLYKNVADLKDATDTNVKALHLGVNDRWNANYQALIWLLNHAYLSNQAPEQKDDYLTKAFANSDYDLEVVKAVLTDDDIDVVQQYAIWYFTNGDTDKYNVETLPAVTLDNYLDANLTFQKEGGSYQDVMGESYHRQEIANYLYQYLIKSAKEAKEDETVTYPSIQDTTRTAELKDDYYIVGPFHVNSGTATSTEYAITLLDQNENEIARENYRILKEGEEEFTTDNVNEIFDTDYYIYLPVTQENITSVSLNVSYTSFDTRASLWKNNTTNEENVEIYQPLTLVTREKTPHTQRAVVSIDRKTADLALRKYIVKVNDTQLNREPTVDVTNLKNGTSQTATYKHAKDPIEVSTGDTIIYEIRVYNEADVDGIATTIYDALPAGLLLVDPSESTINSTYGWEIDTEGTNRNVYKTEYLKDTVIPAFDKENDTELHSAYVQIECKIADDANPASVLTNIAEIGEDNITDRDSTEKNNDYVENDLDSKNYTGDKDNKSDLTDETYFYQGVEDDDDFEKVVIAGKAFDLSLQKFISRVNKNAPSPSREPKVDVSKLKDGTSTDATYTTTKTPVTVKKGDVVIYTIRVYNEGDLAGYAEEVSDYLPEGLGYLVNHTVNVDNYWAIPEDCNTVKLTTIDDSKNNLSADDFNGVTSLDEVEVAVGKVKLTSTKLKSNETDTKNLIKPFDKENGTALDYKDIQVACIVLTDTVSGNNFRNIGEITKDSDENKEKVQDRDSVPDSIDPDNYSNDGKGEDDDDYEVLTTEDPKVFDLSLQKFITGVNDTSITDRVPTITQNSDGTLRFSHSTDALSVNGNDLVTFTIRVYNEGEVDGYAKEVTDYLPKGLEFVSDNAINQKYGWKLYDANDNETSNLSQATKAKTDYLSKKASEERNEDCLIKAFDKTKEVNNTNPDYRDLQIVFRVTMTVNNENKNATQEREAKNIAEISDDEDKNGNPVEDVDSTPGNNKDNEDDIDDDRVYVRYFDLSLKKDLVKIIITENGTTREINVSSTDGLQKVEIHRNRIDTTIVKFQYNITITNEGEIAGYATEIKDYIPEGLEFIATDNTQWTKISDNVITTNALANTLLQPGQSASVPVVLKWINGENNLGLKKNIAEISKDKNDSNTPDIDSTPDNKVNGEDDIDDADVMLAIATGVVTPRYMALTGTVLAIMTTGIVLIKKYVLF